MDRGTMKGMEAVFVVGAAKAGTTSLLRALDRHPQVSVSSVKEPRFFLPPSFTVSGPGAGAYERTRVRSFDDYSDLFQAGSETRVFVEGSTDYLHVRGSEELIHSRFPSAKIIVVVRDPVDRAHSEHFHVRRDCLETGDFLSSLREEKTRREAGWQPLFWHTERSLYFEAISRFGTKFGPENVLVLNFGDLQDDWVGFFLRICEFVGIDKRDAPVLPHENRSGEPRFRAVQRLIMSRRVRKLLLPFLGQRAGAQWKIRLSEINLTPTAVPTEAGVEWVRERCWADFEKTQRMIDG